jgi:hypothetical protein
MRRPIKVKIGLALLRAAIKIFYRWRTKEQQTRWRNADDINRAIFVAEEAENMITDLSGGTLLPPAKR